MILRPAGAVILSGTLRRISFDVGARFFAEYGSE